MSKTEMIRARVEPVLKHEAEAIFAALGLSATEAITLFYRQVSLHHGLPFEVKIPNARTFEAMRQASGQASDQVADQAGEKNGLRKYDSVKEMMADIDDA